jgi:4-hydroxybenzoyl-CoA thioesterase
MPLVDVRANCRKPLRFGDVVEIASRVSEFRRSSFNVEHRITVDGELAVEGDEMRVWAVRDEVNAEKISSRPIPPEIVARFS